MLLSQATVLECARAALALTSPGDDLDALPEAARRELVNYARFILAEGTPADWHDMGVDRIAPEGWTYGPAKDFGKKQAPYLARFSDLPPEVRTEREAVAKAIHDARAAIRERHEAEKRAAEEAAAKAEADRIAAEEYAKWREENPEAAAEKDREEAEAKAAEDARAEAEHAAAETEALPATDEAPTDEPPPAPEAPVEAPPEPPPAPLATSRRSRR